MLQNPRFLGIGCIFVCVGLLLAGLWPLDFFPKNAVRWLPNQDGLDFYGNEISESFCAGGVALSSNTLESKGLDSTMKGAVSIEAWVEPSAEPI